MEDIRTATVAFKALVELGYPLELSRVTDYLTKLPNSNDELIQFDNEEALCAFLKRFPSMFWVQESKVFPSQMKPKGKLKSSPQTQSQQSHSKVQSVSDSKDKARQLEQKVGKGEEVKEGEEKNRSLDAADNVHQTAKLKEDGIRALAEVLKREGPMGLKALLKFVHGLPSEVRSFVGKDKESVIEFLIKHPDIFFIDDDDVVFHVSIVHKTAVQQFKSVLQSKGKLLVNKLTGHISGFKHKYAILWLIGGSPSAVETLLRGYPNTFRVDDRGTVSLINMKTKQPASASACSGGKSKTTSNTTKVAVKLKVPHDYIYKTSEQPKVNKENKLLQEGVKHFKGVLQLKGSMPIERLFGHVNQCRNEVKQAIGTRMYEVDEFLYNYPEVFSVSRRGNVHLVSDRETQQQVDRGKDTLVADKCSSNPKCSNKPKTEDIPVYNASTIVPSEETNRLLDKMTKNNSTLVEDGVGIILKEDDLSSSCMQQDSVTTSISSDSDVYDTENPPHKENSKHGSGKMMDGVQVEKETLEDIVDFVWKCGQVSFSSLQGHATLLGEHIRQCIKDKGGLISFLEHRYDQIFKIDHASESISLKEASSVQATEPDVLTNTADGVQKKQSTQLTVEEEVTKTYAMVLETGQRIQTKFDAPYRSHQQENRFDEGKSMSSTVVVQNPEKTAQKAKMENVLLEGVKHFKQVLESKGSMPVQNIFGHVNQCRDKVKWAIGSTADKVKKFLLGYPEVFHIDKKMIVHLVRSRANKQQERHKTNINQLQIEQKALAHFKGMLSRKGPSTTHVLSSSFSNCGEDIRRHVGNSKEGLTMFFMKHPKIFKVDANKVVYLTQPHMVFKPQRWASCNTLAVPTHTAIPKVNLSKFGGSTPDVRSTVCGSCDKLDSNCSSVARLVDAQAHHQHSVTIQGVEENRHDVSKQRQSMDHGLSDLSSPGCHIGTGLLQEVSEASPNVQGDMDVLLMEDASRSSCHHSPNPPGSHDSEVQHMDQENNQWEPDQKLDLAEVEKETLELVVDLVQKCEQVSLRSLQGHINLLTEEKQDCINGKGGLLTFLQHHYGQIFQIDHESELVSLKRIEDVQEAEPRLLISSADEEQLQPTVEKEVDKVEYSIENASIEVDIRDSESTKKNHNVPIIEAGDDTGDNTGDNSPNTEEFDGVDHSTVAAPPTSVANETDAVSPVSPVQTLGPLPGQYLNQEQAVCDSSGLPTATVHPMTPPSVNNNVPCADGSSDDVYTERGSIVDHNAKALHSTQPDVTATHHFDLTSAPRALQTGVQEDLEDVRTDTQVSHTSTAEDEYALPASSVDISSDSSQSLQGTTTNFKDNVWAGSNPSLGQGWPLQLLGTDDGAGVWADSRKQDEQLFEAVYPAEFVVPGASAPGYDDFTSLLPMFKDNLRPIQDSLVEVEMDIGRVPIARYYNPQGLLLAAIRLSEQNLTRETLETILFALPLERSAIGQGRVLLRGSLHWISTLKNSLGEVVGLTLRRGQAVPGCLDLLWDVVTSGTSTLIVGRPCSGKTTLLREWARVLSDVCYRRVIVVDTLNEIAGGDDIPHPGIGGARRVQVHNRCDQVSQLQTAARNHSPDCIIVDEVQTQEEVTALQVIRLTGIQVVAGVCAGCLTDLLHNSVMRGLLGLSDPPSSTSAPLGVNQQPLTFPQTLPVFQAAVTIHNRDTVSVYSDVASFVRVWLLEGRFPLAQHRKRVV